MDVSRPYSAVVPSLDGDVLVVLAGTTRRLTGREVARIARRGSQSQINRVLRRLQLHGLVLGEPAGRATLYELNRSHLLAAVATGLAEVRVQLISKIAAAIGSWSELPLHSSLFGSAARGDGSTSSDIDILLVRRRGLDQEDPTWRDQIFRLSTSLRQWTGNSASVLEVAEEDLPDLRNRPIAGELDRDSRLIQGMPIRQLLRRERTSESAQGFSKTGVQRNRRGASTGARKKVPRGR